jgi:large subunit ribosomal protein L6
MSKIGQQPVPIPEGAHIQIQDHQVQIQGPLGQLSLPTHPHIKITIDQDHHLVTISRDSHQRHVKALHGLVRSLIANHFQGVTQGWTKSLELVGTGYRVSLQGQNLNLKIGFSHPVTVTPPEGIKFEIEGNNKIHVRGIDKALVGQVTAKIRALRKPEPYKGKGVRYLGEVVRRKPGKAAKAAG